MATTLLVFFWLDGASATATGGAGCLIAGQVFVAGLAVGDAFVAGPAVGSVFVAGPSVGEVFCQ